MQTGAPRVVRVATVVPEMRLVLIDRFRNRDRSAVIVDRIAGLAAAEAARGFDGLPIAQDGGRRGWLKVVGYTDLLELFGAAVSDAHAPGSGPGIAPITEMNARRDLDVMWFLRNRQLPPRGGGFQFARARLGHR